MTSLCVILPINPRTLTRICKNQKIHQVPKPHSQPLRLKIKVKIMHNQTISHRHTFSSFAKTSRGNFLSFVRLHTLGIFARISFSISSSNCEALNFNFSRYAELKAFYFRLMNSLLC